MDETNLYILVELYRLKSYNNIEMNVLYNLVIYYILIIDKNFAQ